MIAGETANVPATALVVDDDDFVRAVVVQMLRRIGIANVHTAESGASGAEVLRREGALELIVCDLMMPTGDGLDLMHDIVTLSPNSRLILMSSADARVLKTAREVAQSRGLNILGSLAKPVSVAGLTALLNRTPASARHADTMPTTAAADVTADELRTALREGQLSVAMQPQLCLRCRQIVGAEALVRWHSPARGAVAPDQFLPQVTQAGMMGELTEFVMQTAIAHCGQWKRQGLDIRVAINFASETLADRELPNRIAELAAAAGVSAARIVAEVTESGLLADSVDPQEVMTRLRLRDIELSIDDFGTGYSTLERLRRLPFTEFKIDRQFVSMALADEQARRIVESNINLAHGLNLLAVAEGVETEGDLELMAQLGCDIAQGFFIARPMPAEELVAWSAVNDSRPCAVATGTVCPFADDCKLVQR